MNDANLKHLGVQYADPAQQEETATLGMWVFLATEVLFFGGLFLSYVIYRVTYPEIFVQAGSTLNITIGTINTGVLLLSSYCMALAVAAIKANLSKRAAFFLGSTWTLGLTFLLLKAYEYSDDIRKNLTPSYAVGPAKIFYFIYYAMTGLHALHLTIGLGVVSILFFRTLRKQYSRAYFTPIEVGALYWHFIDIIWIFLYPLLYLMGRHL
jgi:cytochrome c oxidase subunit 3